MTSQPPQKTRDKRPTARGESSIGAAAAAVAADKAIVIVDEKSI